MALRDWHGLHRQTYGNLGCGALSGWNDRPHVTSKVRTTNSKYPMTLLKKPSIEALNLYFLNRGFERLILQGEGDVDEEDCKVNSKERE